uniref:Isoform 2 of NACHT domain- and WD repeat-containing protein 1 n=1 Tax=Homo sapiens TaxID=9606 RepID=Q149M9-2
MQRGKPCRALPTLKCQTFCQRHGLMFEVVDLRWGIRNIEATDHLTTELCLEEVDRCWKTSIGPAFVEKCADPCPGQ